MGIEKLGSTNPRVVILGAGVGAGHNFAARELQKKFESRGIKAEFHDYLDILPWMLRLILYCYGPCVNHLPWLFSWVMTASEET